MEPSSPLNGPGIPRRGSARGVSPSALREASVSADNGAAAAHAFRRFKSEDAQRAAGFLY